MNIFHYLDTNELIVYATENEYVSLGERLIKVSENICLKSEDGLNNLPGGANFVILIEMQCIVDPSYTPSGTIKFAKESGSLVITGDSKGLRNFGQGLINIFTNAKAGTHLHLDDLCSMIAPSECDNVIFELQRSEQT